MSRNIGNRIGSGVSNSFSGGIFNLIQQNYLNIVGKWNSLSATGGTILTPGNGYKYHIFTSSGTFQVVSGSANIEYVIVAGGGAGAGAAIVGGGGGGAGGYRSGSLTVTNSPGTYTIVVGGGGSPSSAFGITATRGGGGGIQGTTFGEPGGSGGGSGYGGFGGEGNAGGYYPIEGNPAGTTATLALFYTQTYGSGGGALSAGKTAGSSSVAGSGINAFSGDLGIPADYGTPGPGLGRWFAGGGAGTPGYVTLIPAANGGGPTSNTGGVGGGGNSYSYTSPTDFPFSNGKANTGSGGGSNFLSGGNGGSGIVIIRYKINSTL